MIFQTKTKWVNKTVKIQMGINSMLEKELASIYPFILNARPGSATRKVSIFPLS